LGIKLSSYLFDFLSVELIPDPLSLGVLYALLRVLFVLGVLLVFTDLGVLLLVLVDDLPVLQDDSDEEYSPLISYINLIFHGGINGGSLV
jgi:hypothetical protein